MTLGQAIDITTDMVDASKLAWLTGNCNEGILQSGPIKARTLSVLCIQNHALVNSVIKLSAKLHIVSNNM